MADYSGYYENTSFEEKEEPYITIADRYLDHAGSYFGGSNATPSQVGGSDATPKMSSQPTHKTLKQHLQEKSQQPAHSKKFCDQCGVKVSLNWQFCSECGVRL